MKAIYESDREWEKGCSLEMHKYPERYESKVNLNALNHFGERGKYLIR